MGCLYGLGVLVVVALLLALGQGLTDCTGIAGVAGQAGVPGRDGRPGAKGEKGEPAAASGPSDPRVLLRSKGDTGSPGLQGAMGPKGYRGEVGPMGHPGSPGPAGLGGNVAMSAEDVQQSQSVFSVLRTAHSYPPLDKIVTYQVTLVNRPGDFDAATGIFTCRKAGVYYFTFQSMAKVSVCLRIASDAPFHKPGFCDYNRNVDQVLTGGVVLQLAAGQKVWLESFRDQQTDSETRDLRDKKIFFSGFLIFPD